MVASVGLHSPIPIPLYDLRREAEGVFVFGCERTDPTFFRDDLIPAALLRAIRYVPSWFLANGARSSFHVQDFSACPFWPEVCEPAEAFVLPTSLQNCSFSLISP